MSDCAERLNPKRVEREGISRTERMQNALHPAFAKVIEHGSADWMVYAKRLAEYIHFVDSDNQLAGNWEPFFAKDPSVLLALAAVQRVDFYKQNLQGYLKYLLESDHEPNVNELKQHFGAIFNSVGTLATQLDLLQDTLPLQMSLKNTLQSLIRSQLAGPFERLKLHFQAAVANNLIDLSMPLQWSILGSDIVAFDKTVDRIFSPDWNSSTNTGFDAESILGNPAGSVFERLNFAAGHNLFADILDQFLKVYARVVTEAKSSLEKTLTEQDSHQPHYALFLAFLRLLEYARDHANTLTGRHLDFYYKEVLQLIKRPAEPNHVHLVFELAKHRDTHLIKKGTAFKGGKDSSGKPVEYHLAEDFVVNRAKVTRLQSLHHNEQLFAFPVTNSQDGRGSDLDTPDGQWDAFVRTDTIDDLAQVGFAIASHYLYLREGQRRIWLRLHVKNLPKDNLLLRTFCQSFDFWLTGEKGWVKASLDESAIATGNLTQIIEIPLLLDGGQPPIVPLLAKPHGHNLPEGLPTLKVLLRQDGATTVSVKNLQDMAIVPAQSSLVVAVGYDDSRGEQLNGQGLKDLHIVSKLGTLKPDKPFLPFGPLPEKEDALIIGSDEAMQKEGAALQFQVRWKGLPDWRGDLDYDWVNEFTPRITLQMLKNGRWEDSLASDKEGSIGLQIINEELEPQAGHTFPLKKIVLPSGVASEPHFNPQTYGVNSRNGFLRLELLGDFGHKLYQLTLPRYLMRVALKETIVTDKRPLRDLVYDYDNDKKKYIPHNEFTFIQDFVEHFSKAMPTAPYTPEVESLILCYTASVQLNNAAARFYQLTPFGYCPAASESSGNLTLFKGWPTQGELFIGIEELKPPQNLSLLFQLAEGSADPTVLKPAEHLTWSYLSGNEWKVLSPAEFSDQTGQLTRSGIIRFSVPKDATNHDSHILPAGSHWIRMSLTEKPEAICKIISIAAQAALASFIDTGNAADFLAAQTPAGSITKFNLPDAAVKKLIQPYATFGGRQVEAEDHFYTRISERLRHKQRAITVWDYEHLILEAFPQIFKVKCLNHTRFEPAETGKGKIYNELAPGHVTVVTIPDLLNRNAIDPLRPYTNLGDLALIKEFLQKHVPCFVQLHLQNPVYEEVRVKFRVKFFPGVDETFHRELLQKTVVRHLAPWAFGDSRDIRFGGRLYKSALIDLVEEQPYVDYVTDFQLFHESNGDDQEEVQASVALAVLTPAPAEQQSVEVIAENPEMGSEAKCRC
ncbi:baseplate J/gp47 family protein [Haliscomenobacter hydrossis]|uniref:Uncharacterized protein n=1 Tax=Haliscomenobacter hydrossis (strain ATCC 27775 / DSM 1100 / LMG 10767 / O) TaxID=760192 RepID=F4L0G8_HALH1|nr:baseplate J/gp47 family protein [Haliscomenobacter hydrossis]AEE48480.1 hypothetical protein Halhy_0571 [Haliscomenobacter hydrossis DSM 1100]